jgi:hypothetical protein
VGDVALNMQSLNLSQALLVSWSVFPESRAQDKELGSGCLFYFIILSFAIAVVFFSEIGSCHIAHSGLGLMIFLPPPPNAGITDGYHHTGLQIVYFRSNPGEQE